MMLIGACVEEGRVRRGVWGLVVKVYGKESPSIRGHLKSWSACSRTGHMLQEPSAQMAERLKRFVQVKGHRGPPGLRRPSGPNVEPHRLGVLYIQDIQYPKRVINY